MHLHKTIYQTKQIRELESKARDKFAITEHEMMQRAGKGALDLIIRKWPHAHNVLVFCGKGNNGGDGYVFAFHAKARNLNIRIIHLGIPDEEKKESYAAYKACKDANIEIIPFHDKLEFQQIDLIIDGVCGIGLTQILRDDTAQVVNYINRLQKPVLALDVPTGVNADTGEVLGSAVRASSTITFIGYKLGLLTGFGVSYSGEVVVNDLQFPNELFKDVKPVAKKISLFDYAKYLMKRPRDWHKGLSGHILIVGGEDGYSGAARMAGEAALRVGAGLVSIATTPTNAPLLNIGRPELMCHGIRESHDLQKLVERADVVILGPGLAKTEWSYSVWDVVIKLDQPIVLDADGLNILSEKNVYKENWILTPHPGEAARLLKETTNDIQLDRLTAIHELNKKYGGVAVLKGAGSLISTADETPLLCDRGNPGMATAGMGDVLSGVIGGLLAQGVPNFDAASLGVLMHAIAGNLAAKVGERGMIATDLLPYLRQVAN